jgi:hypothetical protein
MVVRLIRATSAALVLAVLGGCASYGGMYQSYLQACSDPQNHKTMDIPVSGTGASVKINQGCTLQAPVDADAKWINAGASLIGSGLNAAVGIIQSNNNKDLQIQANKSNEIIFTEAFGAVGNRIDAGGNVNYTGGDGAASNDTTLPPLAPAPAPAPEPEPEPEPEPVE